MADECLVLIKLDLKRIGLLKLEIDTESIVDCICAARINVKHQNVRIYKDGIIGIEPQQTKKSSLYFSILALRRSLPRVVIKGLPMVSRAVIHNDDSTGITRYKLLVEGNNLREVLATSGVAYRSSTSNNISEVHQTLGIEAARKTVIKEIQMTMESHGLNIDKRHLMLLADLMTCTGDVLGVTRFGFEKMKESVLMLASFEKTSDHLFDAAYYGQKDAIAGVSESIIMGNPIPLGTGLFKLLQKVEMPTLYSRKLLFDVPEFHLPNFS